MEAESQSIALEIDRATTLAALKAAAGRVDALLVLLHDGGIPVERIARCIGELNRRLFTQLWVQVAPAELVANSCLLTMGSEGRGEQLVKTDQDNALLLRDGFELPALEDTAARFAAGLTELGYPPCPGGIMLTNPLWRCSVAAMRDTLREWIYGSDPQGPMRLAIFFDAAAVAGDAALLRGVREYLDAILADGDAFLARFAAAADQFDEASGWWARLSGRSASEGLDLKKLGSFPIVHGVRALCMKHGVRENGTAERLRELVAHGHLDAQLGGDLEAALHCLMGLKLRQQLRQRAAGEVATNLIRSSELSTIDDQRLKNALAIVKRFRALLRQRFQLDSL